MKIENPKFLGDILSNEPRSILAVVDGLEMTIPIDPENRHYSELMRQVGGGELVIEPAEAIIKGPRRIGTPREFLRLFTDAEKTAFFSAKAASVQLELWWAEASTGDFSLDHPSVEAGLSGLVASGILAEDRAVEILSADFDQG